MQGQVLTRQDCVTLFYNLLTTQTSSGSVYGATLGYTITNGEVDLLRPGRRRHQGPYVPPPVPGALPSAPKTPPSTATAPPPTCRAKQYDVYYYNANLRTVCSTAAGHWHPHRRLSQRAAPPPSRAGVSYDIGTSAAYKLSTSGLCRRSHRHPPAGMNASV